MRYVERFFLLVVEGIRGNDVGPRVARDTAKIVVNYDYVGGIPTRPPAVHFVQWFPCINLTSFPAVYSRVLITDVFFE
jgi:hypothetical protein